MVKLCPFRLPLTTYNVQDYGAYGNGTTDDSAALNALMATINGAGGGIMYFPEGIYKVVDYDSTVAGGYGLRLLSNVILLGQGPTKSIIRATVAGYHPVHAYQASNISIRQLGLTNASTAEIDGLKLVASSGISVIGCQSYDNYIGMAFYGCSNVNVLGCNNYDNAYTQYQICYATENSLGASYVTLTDCEATGSDQESQYAINVQSFDPPGARTHHITISGFDCDGFVAGGIWLRGPDDVAIADTVLTGCEHGTKVCGCNRVAFTNYSTPDVTYPALEPAIVTDARQQTYDGWWTTWWNIFGASDDITIDDVEVY